MGQTADELRQEIDQTRDNASQKIDQIEQLVTGAADQVKEQVTQTKERIEQTFDWRHQVEEKPLVALGAAFIGGIVLGGITGGDGGGSQQHRYYGQQPRDNASQYPANDGQATSYGQAAAAGGVMAAVRGAAKKAGLDDTIVNLADGLMATFSDRVKRIATDAFPGLADKLPPSSSTSSSASPAGTSMPAGATARSTAGAGMEQPKYEQSGAFGATHAATGGTSFS